MNIKYFDTKESAQDFCDEYANRPDISTTTPVAVEQTDGSIKWQVTFRSWRLD